MRIQGLPMNDPTRANEILCQRSSKAELAGTVLQYMSILAKKEAAINRAERVLKMRPKIVQRIKARFEKSLPQSLDEMREEIAELKESLGASEEHREKLEELELSLESCKDAAQETINNIPIVHEPQCHNAEGHRFLTCTCGAEAVREFVFEV
jgi:hypothetical protein